MATPSRPTSGMGSFASSSPRTTKIATVDAEKVAMQKEMAAMRAEMAAMKQQSNNANKVMDDHEAALLTKHLEELKQQQGSTQSGKFTLDLAFGTSKDALNLAAFLGMSEEYTREVNRNGEAMMKREIEALQTTGRLQNDPSWWFNLSSDEVLEHWNYVVHETSSEKQYPNGIRDQGRAPTNLEDFMKMPQAIKAKLSRAQVIALRLYTTLIYKYINEPLRHKEFYRTFADQPNQPRHPLSAVVWYIFTGLKQLREVVDMKVGERIVLWRGMKNVSCVPSTFMENGGAEQAPMSTSRDMKVALNYGTDGTSMDGSVLFKIVARNDLEMGADIQWLSAFPQEAEVLYPPLALLIPSKKEIKVLGGGGGVSSSSINIIEMTANLSSGLGLVVGESEDVGFMKGDTVCVLLNGVLVNGEVINVSAGDGVKVKYENGKEDEYIPKKLKKLIENGKQEKIRLEKKAAKEKLAREKAAAEEEARKKAAAEKWERERPAREKAAQEMLVQEKADREEFMARIGDGSALRVKPGLNSLSNALKKAKENGINGIFLENGVHDEKGEQVVIDFPLTIIGESKDGCTIIGGLDMKGKKEDDVNVKHLTISQSKGAGVQGYLGMSFHLFHLKIEKSEGNGVYVNTKRNTMSNCQVSHSKWSGVISGGLITMMGSGTSIHNNGTSGNSSYYGLCTWNSSSSIHLVSPLTKESVSINNGGGGNCGGSGTIKII
jgi:Skp family chaperone for outer membrane proteins